MGAARACWAQATAISGCSRSLALAFTQLASLWCFALLNPNAPDRRVRHLGTCAVCVVRKPVLAGARTRRTGWCIDSWWGWLGQREGYRGVGTSPLSRPRRSRVERPLRAGARNSTGGRAPFTSSTRFACSHRLESGPAAQPPDGRGPRMLGCGRVDLRLQLIPGFGLHPARSALVFLSVQHQCAGPPVTSSGDVRRSRCSQACPRVARSTRCARSGPAFGWLGPGEQVGASTVGGAGLGECDPGSPIAGPCAVGATFTSPHRAFLRSSCPS